MRIWYMSGAGNTFLVASIQGKADILPAIAKKLCKLVGADGFMALDHSSVADFRLHFYNSDGSRAAMCGNGIRCICRFAWENGIAQDRMTVETDAGILFGQRITEDLYQIRMPLPSMPVWNIEPDISFIEVGVPHVVCPYSGDLWADAPLLKSRFQSLRHDPAFPQGTNVNFYTRTGSNSVRVLTYERGVEDFTLACGTGSCAVATVLWTQGLLPGGILTVQNRGGNLTVTLQGQEGHLNSLFLAGDASIKEILEL